MFLFAVFFGILVRQELIGSQKLGAISKAALFFASDDASFITGTSLPVDGGYTSQ